MTRKNQEIPRFQWWQRGTESEDVISKEEEEDVKPKKKWKDDLDDYSNYLSIGNFKSFSTQEEKDEGKIAAHKSTRSSVLQNLILNKTETKMYCKKKVWKWIVDWTKKPELFSRKKNSLKWKTDLPKGWKITSRCFWTIKHLSKGKNLKKDKDEKDNAK